MTIITGNSSTLCTMKGCAQLLSFDSTQAAILTKILPANMIIKDSSTGSLYLTDGIHNVQWVMDHNGLLSDKASSTHVHGNITNDGKLGTASRAVVTDANGAIGVSSVTATELGYVSGVTSSIQAQLNTKLNSVDLVALTDAEIDALMV